MWAEIEGSQALQLSGCRSKAHKIAPPCLHPRVNAGKIGTIWCHNASFGVAIGHSFWKMKLKYLKFLLEIANLEVMRLPFFQKN